MLFFSEYQKLLKKDVEIESEIAALKAKISQIETDLANLRGNFNRKSIGKEKKQEELNTPQPIILPHNGTF